MPKTGEKGWPLIESLFDEDVVVSAKIPSAVTLKRYGLNQEEWQALLKTQGGVCAVCRKLPKNGRLCTDHEHIKGWKKLSAEKRKLSVRGMLCFFCNHYYVGRAITVAKARNILSYLLAYENRKGRKNVGN